MDRKILFLRITLLILIAISAATTHAQIGELWDKELKTRILVDKGEYTKANKTLDSLKNAVKNSNNDTLTNWFAWCRGYVNYKQKKYKLASKDFEKAEAWIQHQPTYVCNCEMLAMRSIADNYIHTGNLYKSERAIRMALIHGIDLKGECPETINMLHLLADIKEQLGDTAYSQAIHRQIQKDVIEFYYKRVTADRGDSIKNIYKQVAAVLSKYNNDSDVNSNYTEYTQYLYLLGRLMYNVGGDYEESLYVFEKLATLEKKHDGKASEELLKLIDKIKKSL